MFAAFLSRLLSSYLPRIMPSDDAYERLIRASAKG